jgi:hypothetical protein
MGLFNKNEKYTGETLGTIVGVSAVEVNKMHLPIAEYEVDGKTFQVRVPYDIAAKMEKESVGDKDIVKANLSFGNGNMRLQATKIQGCKVKVVYNPDKPSKAKVVGSIGTI